ncbi:MAG: hypothetical protein LQ342_004767 [Letrouitia transgressa]|nr:MAG: hypothetical protein LQ342_004767 [Letrouitia transgressa]
MIKPIQGKDLEGKKDAVTGPFGLQQIDSRNPGFGLRTLAMDPNNKRVVLDMENLVKVIFGYEESVQPATLADFEARETRLERGSFAKEIEQGKKPNPNLCRMCRLSRPLMPLDSGDFAWNTNFSLPLGNYSQLLTRKHCSICRLISSLITLGREDALHPRLDQIDPEIQGTQFHIQRLPDGEIMLGVEYSMRTVGALRILKPANLTGALRQILDANNARSTLENVDLLISLIAKNDQKVDVTLFRKWIFDCQSDHGELCNSLGSSPRYAHDMPLYLIDVRH